MLSRLLLRITLALAGVGVHGKEDHDIVVHNPCFVWKVLAGGSDRALGEAYMRGDFTCRRLDLFIERLIRANLNRWVPDLHELRLLVMSWFSDQHTKPKSMRVAAHYDIPPWFYECMLGETMNYTSGVYGPGVTMLDDAQTYKMNLIGRKLPNLGPGDVVLDIGFGWGSLMAHLARMFGCCAVGASISKEQLAYAQKKYAKSNLPLDFQLCDYREFSGRVTHVVSVCMSEHVGVAKLPGYFAKAKSVMSPYGYFVWQGILASKRSARMSGFLDAYIFPGGELPTREEVLAAAKGSLNVLDEHYFPESYYQTLRAWACNLEQHRAAIVEESGEQFYRMFEFYLNLCAGGFKSGLITVGQLVFAPTPRPGYRPVR